MDNIELIVNYNGDKVTMQCKKYEFMKDIFTRYSTKINKSVKDILFLYNGNIVNGELKLEKLLTSFMMETKIAILALDIEDDDDNDKVERKPIIKISKEIICPECLENCIINFNDYRISLYDCTNKHYYSNILIDEFTDFQIINEAKGAAQKQVDELDNEIISKTKQLDEIKKQFDIYKAKMESLLISQLELIKDINKDD